MLYAITSSDGILSLFLSQHFHSHPGQSRAGRACLSVPCCLSNVSPRSLLANTRTLHGKNSRVDRVAAQRIMVSKSHILIVVGPESATGSGAGQALHETQVEGALVSDRLGLGCCSCSDCVLTSCPFRLFFESEHRLLLFLLNMSPFMSFLQLARSSLSPCLSQETETEGAQGGQQH